MVRVRVNVLTIFFYLDIVALIIFRTASGATLLARGQHWLGPTLSGGDFARGDIVWGRHCQGATLFQPGASRVGGDFAGGDFVEGELVRW